jgi:hypothetical protein
MASADYNTVHSYTKRSGIGNTPLLRLEDIAKAASTTIDGAVYAASFAACLPKFAYMAGGVLYRVAKRRIYGQH